MKSSITYHDTALAHEALNKKVTQRVKEAAAVERLYLLGLTTACHKSQSLFSPSSATEIEVTHYYLLALVGGEESRCCNSIQDKIENGLQHLIPVTAIVLSGVQFRSWLWEGHPFACAVCAKALLLYGNDETPMPALPPGDEAQIENEAERLFTQTKTKVQAFLAGAELYTIRKEYKLAAFMLHQAAEQALSAMLTINTGLRVHTHNIDKLLRYCSIFCPELQALFSKRNEKAKRLCNLLQKAYIDTRYRDDFTINYEELTTIIEMVKRLIVVFNQSAETM